LYSTNVLGNSARLARSSLVVVAIVIHELVVVVVVVVGPSS
jgi:hypothetical protein